MLHAIELFSVLVMLAIGEGVLDVSPRVTRRILISLAAWLFAFAAGIAILSQCRLASDMVGLGLILLAAYLLWLLGTSLVRYFRGPQFFEPPKGRELADLAQQVCNLPARDCRRIVKRICGKFDPPVALLGLLSLGNSPEASADDFERAWDQACEKAQSQIARLIRAWTGSSEDIGTSNRSFSAQALTLYERDSAELIFAQFASKSRPDRDARAAVAAQLEQSGKERKEARLFGLVTPAGVADQPASGAKFRPFEILWPPAGLIRCGFKGRAAALAFVHAALIAYGIVTCLAGRDPGWFFYFPGVYFSAAALIHVQALFAIGDFEWLKDQGAAAEIKVQSDEKN